MTHMAHTNEHNPGNNVFLLSQLLYQKKYSTEQDGQSFLGPEVCANVIVLLKCSFAFQRVLEHSTSVSDDPNREVCTDPNHHFEVPVQCTTSLPASFPEVICCKFINNKIISSFHIHRYTK